ncbi:hypothetical protein MN032_10855 [Agromyces atrinae]|uniref:hypothetical protein n=1 Tax=Agromyces atrinae TaxID=592376 RepID=UPI001F599EBF|nr:hypothetical protein [Agromyces atrinae]MCI2958196.1 hypothetical protein [Agromyces atrinae]
MTWTDRIVVDGSDRTAWEIARLDVIGAHDAKTLAKVESVEGYVRQKLTPFGGNAATASGNRWEPLLLAWGGMPENKALIHSTIERGFAATPDGIIELGGGRVGLAECKAKHDMVVSGPTLGEWRQLAWQFLCIPEADWTDFIWGELIRGDDGAYDLRKGNPKKLRIERDHPKVLALTAQLLPIAQEMLAVLRAVRRIQKELDL